MSDIAAGAEPTLGEARRIATALGISLSALTPAGVSEGQGKAALLFRSAVDGPKPELAAQRIAARVEASIALSEEPARVSAPWWWSSFEIGGRSADEAERNANSFRRVFCGDDQLGPLLSLPSIVADRMKQAIEVKAIGLEQARSAYANMIARGAFLPAFNFDSPKPLPTTQDPAV